MRGVPHALVGLGCGLMLSHSQPEIIGLAIVGSLLPDLDGEHSLIGSVPILGPLASLTVRGLAAAISTIRPVRNPFRDEHLIHRGPFHTPLLVALLGSLAVALGADAMLVVAMCVGYLSHLATDGLTKMGIPWLWPIYCTPLRLPIAWRSGNPWIEWPIALGVVFFFGRGLTG